jgi:hypothetical protein
VCQLTEVAAAPLPVSYASRPYPTGRYQLTARHPATGYVSLRATVADADGDAVVQAVLRAYAIGPEPQPEPR